MVEGGISVIKYLLFAFNLIFFLCGSGILGVGIWLRVEKGDYVQFTDYEFVTASNIAIAAGIIIVLVTFLGCVGALKEIKIMLLLFFIALVLICGLEIAAGGLAYANRGKIDMKIREDLNNAIHTKYEKDEGTRKAIDKMQEYFKCCGSADYQDWRTSDYYKQNSKYPLSCCKASSRSDASCRTDPAKLNHGGCYEKVRKFLKENLLIIGITGIVFGVVQILGMIFSMCLYCAIAKQGTYA
eukprot:gene18909-20812_t